VQVGSDSKIRRWAFSPIIGIFRAFLATNPCPPFFFLLSLKQNQELLLNGVHFAVCRRARPPLSPYESTFPVWTRKEKTSKRRRALFCFYPDSLFFPSTPPMVNGILFRFVGRRRSTSFQHAVDSSLLKGQLKSFTAPIGAPFFHAFFSSLRCFFWNIRRFSPSLGGGPILLANPLAGIRAPLRPEQENNSSRVCARPHPPHAPSFLYIGRHFFTKHWDPSLGLRTESLPLPSVASFPSV